MKILNILSLAFFCLLTFNLNAQTCGNHALTDTDGTNADNGGTPATATFPAGPAGTSVSWVGLEFVHTFSGDMTITIDDGTTTVTLFNLTCGGTDSNGLSASDGAASTGTCTGEGTIPPVTGTLASLDGSQPITITFSDAAGGDVYSGFDNFILEYSDGSTSQLLPGSATCPTNDDICNATSLTSDTGPNGGAANAGSNQYGTWGTGEVVGTNYNGEPASSFNTCSGGAFSTPGNPGPSVWHTFTPIVSGEHCFDESTGFAADHQMALYSGTPTCPANDYSGLTQIASSDDNSATNNGGGTSYNANSIGAPASAGDAAFCINLTAGTTYYLQVSTVALYSQTGTAPGCDDTFAQFAAGGAYNIQITRPNVAVCTADNGTVTISSN